MQRRIGEPGVIEPPPEERRKFYFDGGHVEIAAHLVYELDTDGKQLRVIRYTDYAAEKVRTLCPSAPELRAQWADPEGRSEIIAALAERGSEFRRSGRRRRAAGGRSLRSALPLRLQRPVAHPAGTRAAAPEERKDFFDRFGPEARAILEELLEKYAEHGDAQFVLPDVLKVPPISGHGQPSEIITLFGGPEPLRLAVAELQNLLYAA